jgi:hypothetical protein
MNVKAGSQEERHTALLDGLQRRYVLQLQLSTKHHCWRRRGSRLQRLSTSTLLNARVAFLLRSWLHPGELRIF